MASLALPDNHINIDVKDAINTDIIATLEMRFAQAVKDVAPIAKQWQGANRLDTANKIWSWLRNDITYKKDPEGVQDIRMPRYFHHYKTGDCKSFTLNSLAIWHNLYPQDKIRFYYAGYATGSKTPTHVYGKIQPADGSKEIIIDGCWYFVNSEKSHTFGKYSPNMQVRTLSGIGAHSAQSLDLAGMYAAMSPYDKGRMDACMSDLVQLELMKLAKAKDEISPREIESMLSGISARHAKRKSGGKKGGKGKKALHWFNAAALFLGRSAFLLFLTLNVNGLASKIADLVKWGKAGGVLNTWYIMGGNTKKFLQIVNRAKNKKKLFLSKKAKRTYEARYGPLSPNEVAYEKGVHGYTIGVLPALAAAALAVVPVLAGIIPKMIQGFRAAGPQGSKQAAGLIGEGHDLASAVMQNGYPINTEAVNAFMPPGETTDTNNPRSSFDGKPHSGGVLNPANYHFKFDWHDLRAISGIGDSDDDASDTVVQTQDTSTPPPNPEPVPDPNDQFAKTMETLGPILKTTMTAGLATAGAVMSQSQNPNIRKWGNAVDGAESALTGQALHNAGYHDEANYHDRLAKKRFINLFPIAVGAGFAIAAYELFTAKKAA